MKQVKIGIIGVGNMGSQHVRSVGELKNAKLTAVCDIDPEKFSRIDPEVSKKIQKFTDSEEFFKKADIDAVIIAVPHYFHVPLAIRAMHYGKHFIIEKPISVHKALAMKMIREAKKHPELVKSAMFNQRTIEAHKKIKELIDSGKLGTIRRINWIITNWFRTQYYYDSGDWRASWRGEGGGVLLNQCPHQLDMITWFFGMPKTVTSKVSLGKYHKIEVEDDVTAVFEYPNGATGVFISTTGEAPGTNRLEVAADNGRLVFENGKIEFMRNKIPSPEFCKTSKGLFSTPETETIVIPAEAGNAKQHRDIIENFANAILKGKKLIAPVEEGLKGLELGNAILMSGLTGKTVRIPLNAKDFETMLNKLVAKSKYKKAVVKHDVSADDFAKSFVVTTARK